MTREVSQEVTMKESILPARERRQAQSGCWREGHARGQVPGGSNIDRPTIWKGGCPEDRPAEAGPWAGQGSRPTSSGIPPCVPKNWVPLQDRALCLSMH